MQHFLEKFEKLFESQDQAKMKMFQLEINATIESYAEITDHLKKQHFIWNKKTNELCSLRDMLLKQIKQKENDDGI